MGKHSLRCGKARAGSAVPDLLVGVLRLVDIQAPRGVKEEDLQAEDGVYPGTRGKVSTGLAQLLLSLAWWWLLWVGTWAFCGRFSCGSVGKGLFHVPRGGGR